MRKKILKFYSLFLLLMAMNVVYPIGKTFNFLSMIALMYILYSVYSKDFIFEKDVKEYTKAVAVWAMGCLLTSFTADANLKGFDRWIEWFVRIFPLMFLPFVQKQKEAILKMCIAFVFGAVLVLSGILIYRGMVLNELRVGGYFSPSSMSEGVLLGIVIPVLLVCAYDERVLGGWNWCCGITGFICILALGYNNTRGAEVGVLICGGIACSIYAFSTCKKFFLTFLTIVLLTGIVCSSSNFSARWNTKTDGRVIIWQTSWKMFCDHPLFGVGFNRFKYSYRDEYHGEQFGRVGGRQFFHAHNILLNSLVEGGIVGLGTFTFYFVFALWYPFNLWRKTRDPYSLTIFLMTLELFVHGMVETVTVHTYIMRTYWFLLGVLLALHINYRHKQPSDKEILLE